MGQPPAAETLGAATERDGVAGALAAAPETSVPEVGDKLAELGALVASGHRPIPEEYLDRTATELCLTFTDQFGRDHPARAKASLERSAPFENSHFRARKSAGRFDAERPEHEIWFRETTAKQAQMLASESGGTQRNRQHQ
jgi:hypothetical protein